MPEGLGDLQLTRLIREASRIARTDAPMPTADVVQRYLLGHATADDIGQVRAALEHSSSFRRFLRAASADVDRSANSAVSAGFATLPADVEPVDGAKPLRPAMLWYVMPLAIAALVILMISPPPTLRPRTQISLVEASVEPELLMPLSIRGSQGGRLDRFNARDAALARFREMVIWSGDETELNHEYAEDATDSSGYTYALILETVDGVKLGEWNVMLPTKRAEVWLLTLPPRSLYRASVGEGVARFIMESDGHNHICIVWTFAVGSHYQASAGQFGGREPL